MGGCRALNHQLINSLHYRLSLRQHLVVPESQYAEALRFQPARTLFILGVLQRMVTAINFENNLAFETDEINNVLTDRLLASEFRAVDLATINSAPEALLGIGQVFA